MKILGIDPGKTTGWAIIEINERTPKLSDFGTFQLEDLRKELGGLCEKADLIVYEDFVAENRRFTGSNMPATQVIGALKFLVSPEKLYSQSRLLKPVGYGYSNQKYIKGKQGMHIEDAFAHAIYLGVKLKLCTPVKGS